MLMDLNCQYGLKNANFYFDVQIQRNPHQYVDVMCVCMCVNGMS